MSIIPNQWHPSWDAFMKQEIINELNEIENKIGNPIENYFPDEKNVLRFLKQDCNHIKCIIVGMEPYPSNYERNGIWLPQATGRSFEVDSIDSWLQKFKQSSLRNILKTIYLNETNEKLSLSDIRTKIENKTFLIKEPKDWFDSLEAQGVLFLNATLTVIPNKVDTHTKLWEHFMTSLIAYLDKKDIIWFLWGDKARNRFEPNIHNGKIIITCHPRLAQFVDMNCFKEETRIHWLG